MMRHFINLLPVKHKMLGNFTESLSVRRAIKWQVISTDLFAEVALPLPGGGGSGDFSLYCACTFCGKMMRRSSLKRHIEDRHLPSRAVCCQYCSKVFRSNNSLQNHLSIYHRNAERNRKLNKSPTDTKSNIIPIPLPPE
jgi:hypothetical protein